MACIASAPRLTSLVRYALALRRDGVFHARMEPGFYLIFGAVGVFACGVAGALARRPVRLLRAGGKAMGVLSAGAPQRIDNPNGPAHDVYFPGFTFTTARGETIGVSSRVGQRIAPAEGLRVAVLYDPARPHDAELATFRALWLFPTITLLMGLPFLAVGVVGVIALLRG